MSFALKEGNHCKNVIQVQCNPIEIMRKIIRIVIELLMKDLWSNGRFEISVSLNTIITGIIEQISLLPLNLMQKLHIININTTV